MVKWGIKKGNLKNAFGIKVSNEYDLINKPEEVFYLFYNNEFNNIMKKYNVSHLHSVAADGISPIIAEYINELDEETYNHWVNYKLKSCEQEDLLGFSSHMLYIARKQ